MIGRELDTGTLNRHYQRDTEVGKKESNTARSPVYKKNYPILSLFVIRSVETFNGIN